ncbi:ankyrin repeat domain-containing protein 6 [Agrilus planipennis]|uniref:Ankyrin repeat domain-containing protein 6 n=1 Tax=Agrilus planipennis TaxID=224129 RepID=A0A1W4XK33_AGRPL|nr:ankyrin repeat domain-containing protein 6 [Agrilus planipennis]
MSGPGASGGAALRAAAAAGDALQVGRLLGSARCVRFSHDEQGRSALHLAASAGHTAVVRLLLNVAAPKEVDSPDGAGCTPLQRAAADGHEEVVRLLLSRGADIDKQDAIHGNCPLHEAAWKGYSKTVALLASAGADLSRTNAGGFTALHLCCQNGHNQSCRELLLANCNPDLQNNYGDTALHTAARYGHAGVTRILISAKCRVSEQNKNGDTALHIAAAMGRRKLTRILLEANCDKNIRNKQNETARDIALRKDLNEILNILDEYVPKSKDKKKDKGKKKSKTKVTFDGKKTDITEGLIRTKHWSPYGCHYYPDPEAFPPPRLDTLPDEPLKRGEQYYLDLAGNIRKGPVGVGYTCYCAPLFRHLEARLEKDKRELQRAQVRLGQRVAGLEQKLNRSNHGRRSERITTSNKERETTELHRSRSLEMLDKLDEGNQLQTTRSMDELDSPNQENNPDNRPSVKELVARIQQHHSESKDNQDGDNSESSDDEDSPLRLNTCRGPMGDSNLVSLNPNYENVPNGPPRSRVGMYSPTAQYVEPSVTVVQPSAQNSNKTRTYVSSAILPNMGTFQNKDVMAHLRDQPASACIQSVPNLSGGQGSSRYGSPYEPQEPSCSNVTRYGNSNIHYGSSNEVCAGTYYGNEASVATTYSRTRGGYNSPQFFEQNVYYADSNPKYNDLQAKFARLRLLDSSKLYEKGKGDSSPSFIDSSKIFESTTRMLENPQDVIDRDTNNDSGYSTKVYGSSKGNSPCLSGQNENDCLGSSSLV